MLALHEAMMRVLGENPAPLLAGGTDKLESALTSPQWASVHADADLYDQAALLAICIAQAHVFVDNNKRLAYIVATVFLRVNEHPLAIEDSMSFAEHIDAAVAHSETVADVGRWLREILGISRSS